MVRIRAIVAPIVAALTMFLSVTLCSDDRKKPEGVPNLTVFELALKQDSVFALINESFESIKPIFEHSCFDCHTDATDYPWYHALPLIKGMMDDHIAEGREKLDMSNGFPFSGKGNTLELLEEIKEEIENGDMPLLSYRLLHWGTLIGGDKRDSVFQWIDSSTNLLTSFYNRYGVADTTELKERQ